MDDPIARVEGALEAIREGRMVILVDDEDRENEGDLVLAAEHATPEAVNFMVRFARGLVCLSMTEARADALELQPMVEANGALRSTAFTVSIEARTGVTTGISAADRARTIRVAVDPASRPWDLVRPGHIFPLRARPGGVLQRTGHTEGSVDLARLAGCQPAAVICEIMNDDGTMARQDDLARFARTHRLPMLSIADLVQYRLQRERLVHEVLRRTVRFSSGRPWEARVYEVDVDQRQFLTLSFGGPGPEPTLVRVHTSSVFGDVFRAIGGSVTIEQAMARIESEGAGVVLFLPRQATLAAELERLAARGAAAREGEDVSSHRAAVRGEAAPATAESDGDEVLREFGLGAQVLADLGLGKLRVMTTRPRRFAGLDAYGLEVVEQLPIRPDGLPDGERDDGDGAPRSPDASLP
ncbi:MAG TPA: 3,4-dihydroxy-2-butanone-4-phosphate synthase [Polyangiaceae bacterium LLY-WYZ-14_1]|nr:3,4-dihydroxy-2-butanone-4-phosphate synthase [Polyangiaceae bacterium LLY-WYZ-14_1]